MKYSSDIEINLPREQVIDLFDNPDHMKAWQKGFISLTHLSGTAGQSGAQSTLKYKMGKREIEMVETIIKRELPTQFSATYEVKGVWNKVDNTFTEIDAEKTKWVTAHEFRMKGMMKVMAFLMPGMFKKQSFQYMKDFKAFAETGKTVN